MVVRFAGTELLPVAMGPDGTVLDAGREIALTEVLVGLVVGAAEEPGPRGMEHTVWDDVTATDDDGEAVRVAVALLVTEAATEEVASTDGVGTPLAVALSDGFGKALMGMVPLNGGVEEELFGAPPTQIPGAVSSTQRWQNINTYPSMPQLTH